MSLIKSAITYVVRSRLDVGRQHRVDVFLQVPIHGVYPDSKKKLKCARLIITGGWVGDQGYLLFRLIRIGSR